MQVVKALGYLLDITFGTAIYAVAVAPFAFGAMFLVTTFYALATGIPMILASALSAVLIGNHAVWFFVSLTLMSILCGFYGY